MACICKNKWKIKTDRTISYLISLPPLKPNLYRRTKLVQPNWISLLTVDFWVVCGGLCLHFVGLRYRFFFFFFLTTKQTIKNIFTVFSVLPKMFASKNILHLKIFCSKINWALRAILKKTKLEHDEAPSLLNKSPNYKESPCNWSVERGFIKDFFFRGFIENFDKTYYVLCVL